MTLLRGQRYTTLSVACLNLPGLLIIEKDTRRLLAKTSTDKEINIWSQNYQSQSTRTHTYKHRIHIRSQNQQNQKNYRKGGDFYTAYF